MIACSDRVRLLADLGINDTVRTPSGRLAVVRGFDAERVRLRYLDDGTELSLLPHLLTLIERAPAKPVPAGFFNERGAAA